MQSRAPRRPTLITGAAGKTGTAVARSLLARGLPVRALVRRSGQARALREIGCSDFVAGDLGKEEDVARAVRGAGSLYHICPNVHPDELEIGRRVVAAARAAEVGHFVLHSVLHPQTEAMPHHWAKLRVEEHLFESGLPFTILQPAPYMQNLLGAWDEIVGASVYSVPYALATRVVMVDLEDVADVAAAVLDDPRHRGATYELCGPDLPDQREIADTLTRVLGRPIQARVESRDAWTARMQAAGVSASKIGTLVKMFHYYERFGMCGSPTVLTSLLGRPPTTLTEFLQRVARSGNAVD